MDEFACQGGVEGYYRQTVTDEQRNEIDRKLNESRRLRIEAEKAGDKVVEGLRRAAAKRRTATQYRAVDAPREA